MNRIDMSQISIPYRTLETGENLYDYSRMDLNDLVEAEYLKTGLEPEIPDVAALPKPTLGADLICLNTIGISDYDSKKVSQMNDSEKLRSLIKIKTVVEPVAFQEQFEIHLHDAIVESYKKRALTISPKGFENFWSCNNEAILLPKKNIFTNSPCFSMVGMAGSGKSTAAGLTLSRYPKGIVHHLGNVSYVQIPIIAVTAFSGSNMGDLLISMAKEIDTIMGFESVYSGKIKKMKTVGMKAEYICELINIFHIGLLLIDELELLLKSESTNELLTITAKTGVALGVIGTEESIKCFDGNAKLGRRVCANMIWADSYTKQNRILGPIIKRIWRYQYCDPQYEITKEMVKALCEESGGNLDLLTNIFIYAQKEVIVHKTKIINCMLIRQIASGPLEMQKRWVTEGGLTIRKCYKNFSDDVQKNINNEADKAGEREFEQLQEAAEKDNKNYVRDKALNYVIRAANKVGNGYQETAIKKMFLRLEKQNEQFKYLSDNKRTKMVLELLNKKMTSQRTEANVETVSIEQMRKELSLD